MAYLSKFVTEKTIASDKFLAALSELPKLANDAGYYVEITVSALNIVNEVRKND